MSGPDLVREMSLCKVPPLLMEGSPDLDRSLDPTLVSLVWSVIVASPWRYPEHINILELRALTTGVRWVGSFPDSIGARLVVWCDSLVVVYGVRKGRSSSQDLLRGLRKLSAFLLATGVVLYCLWIPTEVNPADGPSRKYEFDSTLGFPGEGPGPKHVFLLQAAFAPATRQKYTKSVTDFLDWMDKVGQDPTSFPELDDALVAYIHGLFLARGGAGRSSAECVVSGLAMFMPRVRGNLPSSCLALKGWRRECPPVPHPPLTWDLAVCIGVRVCREVRWSLGVAVLLAFDCYLRIGELCSIRVSDVADSSDPRMGSAYQGMAIRLGKTKTGSNQWVQVRSVEVQILMRKVVA